MDDNFVQIRINEATRVKLDGSDLTKDYYDESRGVTYHLCNNKIASVPQSVATDWIAIDSTIERVSDPLLS